MRAPLATLSIFLSAFLLFLLEPMVAKMGLPWFGGSPAVWTTCLVFFQVLLLVGYAYSHVSLKLLGPRRQLVVHAVLLLVPLFFLPPGLDGSAAPPPGAWPVPALVRGLTWAVGMPFLVLATNGTLVQRWYSFSAKREPYFLYAASNGGSLLALIAYPFVVEPRLGLVAQARLFSWGYGAWALLSLLRVALTYRHAPVREEAPPAVEPGAIRPAGPWSWTLRAMIPSMLLVAVSLRISTDVGAVPLLWVVPLALYLLSFILAFSLKRPSRGVLAAAAGLAVAMLLGYPGLFQKLWYMVFPLAGLFLGAWLCHADLARDRPPPAQVTAYYLWISVGGAIGSLATNLIAPLIFRSVAEFPLSLALLALAIAIPRPPTLDELRAALRRPANLVALTVPGLAIIAWALMARDDLDSALTTSDAYKHIPFVILTLTLVAGWRLRSLIPFAVAAAVLASFITGGAVRTGQRLLYAQRSFFGTLRVVQSGEWRAMVHGTTNHGMEHVDAPDSPPTMYYHPASPMGRAGARRARRRRHRGGGPRHRVACAAGHARAAPDLF